MSLLSQTAYSKVSIMIIIIIIIFKAPHLRINPKRRNAVNFQICCRHAPLDVQLTTPRIHLCFCRHNYEKKKKATLTVQVNGALPVGPTDQGWD